MAVFFSISIFNIRKGHLEQLKPPTPQEFKINMTIAGEYIPPLLWKAITAAEIASGALHGAQLLQLIRTCSDVTM